MLDIRFMGTICEILSGEDRQQGDETYFNWGPYY